MRGYGPLAPTGAPAGLGVVEAPDVSWRANKEPADALVVPVPASDLRHHPHRSCAPSPVTRSLAGAGSAMVPVQARDDTMTVTAVPDPLVEQIVALEALGIEQLRSRWAE